MKEYRQFMKSAKAPKDMQDVPLDELDNLMKKNDKAFNKFQKRIKLEPEQVMPQLLNYLSIDSGDDIVDWGTLAVYTCSKSCEQGIENYAKEFIWKQDVSDNQRE
ncbi:programmed cell death protein 2 [Trichonephila inaurata madagascariensis]|uniref:Programmed cell death protein 2 n=1 Tax=Trichonephila inaurata madagascariensis TaxID=2747483 RepID=A0A8X6IF46_9ARAC|nr:programmed cell death protein 2 [Trichonephila inaurata madagascariensis]